MAGAAPLPAASLHTSSITRAVLVLGRVGLGAVFVYAAYTKLLAIGFAPFQVQWRSTALLAMSVHAYEVLPEWGVTLVARTLPWIELAVGTLLLIGYQLKYTSAAATALLAFFFALMLRSYLKGLGIDCGCFGLGEKLSVWTLIRDGALVAAALALTLGSFFSNRKSAT